MDVTDEEDTNRHEAKYRILHPAAMARGTGSELS
jgi:hypothetical protein